MIKVKAPGRKRERRERLCHGHPFRTTALSDEHHFGRTASSVACDRAASPSASPAQLASAATPPHLRRSPSPSVASNSMLETLKPTSLSAALKSMAASALGVFSPAAPPRSDVALDSASTSAATETERCETAAVGRSRADAPCPHVFGACAGSFHQHFPCALQG